jgi:hypothetical protein
LIGRFARQSKINKSEIPLRPVVVVLATGVWLMAYGEEQMADWNHWLSAVCHSLSARLPQGHLALGLFVLVIGNS